MRAAAAAARHVSRRAKEVLDMPAAVEDMPKNKPRLFASYSPTSCEIRGVLIAEMSLHEVPRTRQKKHRGGSNK